uniref:Bm10258, isoform a n=1 Tax=Brugia malayi TaxID=6279 RepID=A0A1I9G365_BRUMA|nr:Bm10258, isoform a [Brugia malayi]
MICHQGGHEVITGCGLHVLPFREGYLLLREIVERMSKGTNYSFEARWFSVSGDINDDESDELFFGKIMQDEIIYCKSDDTGKNMIICKDEKLARLEMIVAECDDALFGGWHLALA